MREETELITHQKCADALTADHGVLDEENETRVQHRHAVAVQKLFSHWIQRYTTKLREKR